MRASSQLGALLSTVLSLVTANPLDAAVLGRAPHNVEVARRTPTDISRRATISGPYTDAQFTVYDPGLGACGITNVPSDFVVALDSDQYGSGYPGPNCFLSITIQVGNTTAIAQITEECPSCPLYGLQLTPGLFEVFAALEVGVLYGTWWVN
ncbi:hypothetical protein BKA93DRAFT_750563 [Sparassis latifolia]